MFRQWCQNHPIKSFCLCHAVFLSAAIGITLFVQR